MKKVISCILTFILILNVLPVIAFGDSTDLDIIVEDFADMSDLSLSGLTEVSTGQQNGSTSFTAKTATFSAITKNISPAINIVDYAKMHLAVTFGFYIENASLLQPSQFELTSSGKCDVNEIHWNFDKNTVKNGWNILTFRFDNADIVGGDINLSNINYFRTFLNLTAQTKVGFSTAKIILSGENTIENFIIFDGENTTGCRTTANSVGIISSLDTENFTEGKSSIEYYTTTTNQFIFFYDYITDNGKAFTLGDFEYVEGDFYSHREMIANVVFSFVANTVNVSGTDYKFSSPVFFPKNTWTHFKIPLNQFVDDTTNGAPTRNAINRISLRLTNLTDRDGNPLENGRACVDNFRLTKNSMGENNTFTTMSDTMWEDYFENTPPEFKQLLGDVSIDNKINSNDALLALKHSVELIELDEDMQKLADVNANDTVTVVDALIILQYSVKLVANLPLVDRSEDKDMTKFTSPTVIKNSYNREGLFVAEVAATADKFGADPTGVKDSTAAIQSAIDYCADELNGGVVYLPAGKYRVEGTITVKTGTTLIGDYVDPDDVNNSDYGTMFMVYTDKRFADGKAVISMQTGTAINGITFYYPEQTVDNPIDYYYTISTEGAPSPRTITNITLLNSYCGIESSKNHAIGMSTITNIKGTALKTGMSVYNTADICLYTDITFSPHYWADMDEEFSPPAQTAIRTLLKSNESIGIYVRDLDRDNFRNIYIDGYYYGFYGDTPQRGHWSGSVFNARILNASYGVYTKTVNLAYGVNFAESRIDGSVKAVVNEGEGYLTFNNCTLMGSKSGKTTLLCNPLDKYEEEQPKISLPNKNDLFNFGDYNPDMTGQTDVTVLLQKALDDAEQNGGGIVYIPGGRYRIDGSVSVAEGIMLVGSSYYSTNTPKKERRFIFTVNPILPLL